MEALMQFVKFGIVGVSNTVVSYVIYVVFLLLFQAWKIFSVSIIWWRSSSRFC